MEILGGFPTLFRMTAGTLTAKMPFVFIFVAGSTLSRQWSVTDHRNLTIELLDDFTRFGLVAFRTFCVHVFSKQRIPRLFLVVDADILPRPIAMALLTIIP